MKSVKVVFSCALALLLFVFITACGGQDDNSELLRANEQLQEEIEMLRSDIRKLISEHSSLQAELNFLQDQAGKTVNQSVNGIYQEEFPMFHHDLQSLLNDTNLYDTSLDEFSIEQVAWQNLSAQSAGREYILWRGSWNYLSETEYYVNLLVSHGWELVNMFGAGIINGIVVVMRR